MKQRRTGDLAYEPGEAYARPARLPPVLTRAEYEQHYLNSTKLPGKFARTLFRASRIGGFIEQIAKNPDAFDRILRRQDARFAPFSLPTLNATLVLRDDAHLKDPFDRAAALVLAARGFHDDLTAGNLTPDTYKGEPLEMGQYPNLFGTCLRPEGTCTRVQKTHTTDKIIVAVRGHFYVLDIEHERALLGFSELRSRLEEIASHAYRQGSPGNLGTLTAGNFIERLRTMRRIRRSPENRAALVQLADTLFVLCLDFDAKPRSEAATITAMHREIANRFHLASLQIVVTGTARAGIVTSFSCGLDGNVMVRFASELRRRSAEFSARTGPRRIVRTNARTLAPLRFDLDPKLVERATERTEQLLTEEPGVFSIHGIGNRQFKRLGMSSDALFNIALLATAKRLFGVAPNVLEHTSMSRYRNMGVEMARITSPEAERFVMLVSEPNFDRKQAYELLRQAEAAHRARLRSTREQISLKWLSMLHVRQSSALHKLPAWLLALSVAGRPDVIVSQPAPNPEIACVGRPGIKVPYVKYFGLHYQIYADSIGLVLMRSQDFKLTDRVFFAALETSLRQVLSVAEAGAQPSNTSVTARNVDDARDQVFDVRIAAG